MRHFDSTDGYSFLWVESPIARIVWTVETPDWEDVANYSWRLAQEAMIVRHLKDVEGY